MACSSTWNNVDWDWRTGADDRPEELYALWRDALTRSRALISEALRRGDPELPAKGLTSGQEATPMVRHVLLNMIEEYARHNGHADLIRELVDGLVGHDPPSGTS